MIAKKYRLNEREVGKVLSRRKPFFSYMFIANVLPNTLGHSRCAILLSGKVARGSVNRNFWRRQFYDISLLYLENCSVISKTHQQPTFDIVFVPKKGTILHHSDKNQLAEYKKNIQFIYKKIQENQNTPKIFTSQKP